MAIQEMLDYYSFDYERVNREFRWYVPEDCNFGFDVVDRTELRDEEEKT